MDVDNKSLAAQNALLSKLGISTTQDKNAVPKEELGQTDFLKLMTAQLQNQDPFAPMDNGDFIAQMAQFSSVAGISKMSETMSGIADQMVALGIVFEIVITAEPGNMHVVAFRTHRGGAVHP